MELSNKKIPIIVIAGATATGKSALALELAQRLGGEIISGDSMQLYRGMDIGTSKASVSDRKRIRHHLIDVRDIEEPFSVKEFITLAKEAAVDIYSRGKLPILVGGTGLYIKMTLEGTMLPETDPTDSLRAAYTSLAKAVGSEYVHNILRCVDRDSAERIHPNNLKRVIRALELYHTTGKTAGEHNSASKPDESPFAAFMIYLKGSREWLYDRINKRVDRFFEEGLEAEVRKLYERGLDKTLSASQAIGYKEFFAYFEGRTTIEDVREQIKKSTRNYAKRQETFFNSMTFDHIMDAEEGSCEIKVNNIEKLLKSWADCDII